MRVCCFEVLGLRFRLPNGTQEPMPQSHLSAIIVTIIIAIVMITLIIVAFSMRRTCPHTPPHAIGCCYLRSINAATAGNLRAVKITTFSTLTSASASPIQRRKYRKLRHRVHDMYEAGGGSSDAHAASGVWRVNFAAFKLSEPEISSKAPMHSGCRWCRGLFRPSSSTSIEGRVPGHGSFETCFW